jgi:hypothetical protein
MAQAIPLICSPCDQTCKTCVNGTSSGCKSCYIGRFLYAQQCLTDCPTGYKAKAYPKNVCTVKKRSCTFTSTEMCDEAEPVCWG